MVTLIEILRYLRPSLTDKDFFSDIQIRDDGDGEYVAVWNTRKCSQPSQADIDNATSAADLYWCKTRVCETVNKYWENAVNSGFNYNYYEEDYLFAMDDRTLFIIGCRLVYLEPSGSATSSELSFYTVDSTQVVFLSVVDFSTFCRSLIAERNRLDQKRLSLKKQISDAGTADDVLAIDILTGW